MNTEITEKLTNKEFGRLLKLETTIGKGMESAVEVWVALEEIRDSRLYRQKHKSFDDYCQNRWKMSRRYADMLIKSAYVVKGLPKKVRSMLLNPRQVDALEKVAEGNRELVVENASKSGKITAKAITESAAEIDQPHIVAGPVIVLDTLGIRVTNKALPYWERGDEIRAIMKQLSEIKCTIEKALKSGDKMFVEVPNAVLADLMMCRQEISMALPYTVCPAPCNGQMVDKCGMCNGRGVISKERYGTVPAKVRAMHENQAKKGK
jgi:hypothetical protein